VRRCPITLDGKTFNMHHGDVVIAAITSCHEHGANPM